LKRILESGLCRSIQINYHNYNNSSNTTSLDPATQKQTKDHLLFVNDMPVQQNRDPSTQIFELPKESSVTGRTELAGESPKWIRNMIDDYEGLIREQSPPAVNYASKPKLYMPPAYEHDVAFTEKCDRT
jgi:hypothetical protein